MGCRVLRRRRRGRKCQRGQRKRNDEAKRGNVDQKVVETKQCYISLGYWRHHFSDDLSRAHCGEVWSGFGQEQSL
jgi:hypothetical protein